MVMSSVRRCLQSKLGDCGNQSPFAATRRMVAGAMDCGIGFPESEGFTGCAKETLVVSKSFHRVKEGNDLEGMRNAVFASFLHALSTDEDPHHDRCPAGSSS